jgi:hypothetical protein
VSKTDLAVWLGLYASAVASITGLWALFRELWIERPRIDVAPEEAWLVRVKGQERPLIVKGEDNADDAGARLGAQADPHGEGPQPRSS